MQVVLLVAGKGTRMGEATRALPKPLLEAGGKSLLEHKLDMLPDEIDDIVLVVGYHGRLIRDKIRDTYNGRRVRYAEQSEYNGTAGALLCAKELVDDRFLVMMGDDIYAKEDVEACMEHEWAICAKKVKNREMGGEILLKDEEHMIGMHEQRHFVQNGLINTGMYALEKSYFDEEPVLVEGTNEIGIPHTLAVCAQQYPVKVIVSDAPWMQVSNQDDLKQLNELLAHHT
jgi:NDP-sugar pyrophosphorylase family protein